VGDKINRLWSGAIFTYGSVEKIIFAMIKGAELANIKDARIHKLLKLASCPSAPIGEKENAAKMAFKFMELYFK
jgi:hypothetical protein